MIKKCIHTPSGRVLGLTLLAALALAAPAAADETYVVDENAGKWVSTSCK